MARRKGLLIRGKGAPVGVPRKHTVRKQLIVEFDSLFDQNGEPLLMAVPALEKVYRAGWSVSYWTTVSRNQYVQLTEKLQQTPFWNYVDPENEDFLLIRCVPNGESPDKTKLSLLEQNFGKILDEGKGKIVFIEKDEKLAYKLKSYASHRISVHLAPRVWLNLIAIGSEMLDAYLWKMGLVGNSEESRDDETTVIVSSK